MLVLACNCTKYVCCHVVFIMRNCCYLASSLILTETMESVSLKYKVPDTKEQEKALAAPLTAHAFCHYSIVEALQRRNIYFNGGSKSNILQVLQICEGKS